MHKTVVRFFTIADYEEEELWLRTQHNSGWKLVKVTPPCFYVFESCKREDVVYRLDYRNNDRTEGYAQMAEDFGWECVERSLGWLYFRKPAGGQNEDELFSDDASRAEMVGHIIRTRMLPIAIIFICCVVPNLINALRGNMAGLSGFFAGVFGVLFVIYIYIMAHCGLKLKRKKDRFERLT